MQEKRNQGGVALVLSYPSLGLVRAVARDLLGDDLRVDTGAVALRHHATVEVLLAADGPRRGGVHRFQAAVAGTSREGTTLLIRDCPAGARRTLQEGLRAVN